MKFLCIHLQTIISITFGTEDFLNDFFQEMDNDNSESIDKDEFAKSFIETLFNSFDQTQFSEISESMIEN